MVTSVLYTLAGAAIGAAAGIGLYVLGFCIELVNCVCMIVTCNCSGGDAIPGLWQDGSFGFLMLICTAGGAIIGCLMGVAKAASEADEERKRQRAADDEALRKQQESWATSIKGAASKASNNCKDNLAHYQPLVSTENKRAVSSTSLKSTNTMKDIMAELVKVSEVEGEMNAITDYLKEKER